tara:strand:+ start:819 stop:1286 length:468 start_codon:yes stop_codon:yes gene_type:complete
MAANKKMTVTDRRTLVDIIIDKIRESNEAKLSAEEKQDLIRDYALEICDPYALEFEDINNKRKELRIMQDELEAKMKIQITAYLQKENPGNEGYIGYYNGSPMNCHELISVLGKKIDEDHDIKDIPNSYDIEKKILLSTCTDYSKLVMQILKEYT